MNATRDAYVEKMKATLDKWNAEITKLEAEARQNRTEAQQQIRKQIESLKKKRRTTEENLDKMRHAGEGAWENLKIGVENALGSLGDAVRSATSRFE
jgi:predicted  nucleic acid-binding Zn-ribbon protein